LQRKTEKLQTQHKQQMARILTGIQSSGKPHLGNILGAIIPAIALSKTAGHDSYYFIADYHSLTTIKNAEERRQNVFSVAAAWLAFGFDTDRNTLFVQSHVREVTELAWYLGCFTPYPMLANAHSFKEKSNKLSDVNAGLFTYPVLMAADILLYDVNLVPVGKDQLQHIEIARDLASAINFHYNEQLFVVPEAKVQEDVMLVPGTDGAKMSKSYNNYIDIFEEDEKKLRKVVMSIKTDSKPLEEPKNPDTCTVFKLYSLIADEAQTAELRAHYLNGNYGYGAAKQALFDLIMTKYKQPREKYAYYMRNTNELEILLKKGAEKASLVAAKTMGRVRKKLGF
jgi:tryptophanyl-tRNA synthetase